MNLKPDRSPTPLEERLRLLRAELADVQEGLKRRPKGPEKLVFEEMAGDLEAEIKLAEAELKRQQRKK